MIGKVLNWFGVDGLAHVLASLVLCAVLGAFMPLWAAVLVTLAVGVAKELVWDMWLGKGTAEWRDMVSDTVGIALGAALVLLNGLM